MPQCNPSTVIGMHLPTQPTRLQLPLNSSKLQLLLTKLPVQCMDHNHGHHARQNKHNHDGAWCMLQMMQIVLKAHLYSVRTMIMATMPDGNHLPVNGAKQPTSSLLSLSH
jgi:hypothetical protein